MQRFICEEIFIKYIRIEGNIYLLTIVTLKCHKNILKKNIIFQVARYALIFLFQLAVLKCELVADLGEYRSATSSFPRSYLFQKDFRVGEMSGLRGADICKDDTEERVHGS